MHEKEVSLNYKQIQMCFTFYFVVIDGQVNSDLKLISSASIHRSIAQVSSHNPSERFGGAHNFPERRGRIDSVLELVLLMF